MRESVLITEFSNLWRGIRSVAEGLKISVLSQSCRDAAIEKLLIKKGIFSKEELDVELKSEAEIMMAEAKSMQATPQIITSSPIIVPDNVDKTIILPADSSNQATPLAQPTSVDVVAPSSLILP